MENKKYIKYKIKYKNLLDQIGSAIPPIPTQPVYTMPVASLGKSIINPNNIIPNDPYRNIVPSISGNFAMVRSNDEKQLHAKDGPHDKPLYCNMLAHYPKKNIDAIRIVSYNVHNFVKQCTDVPQIIINRANRNIKPGRNYKATLFTIYNLLADIVFLQEVVPKFNVVQVTEDKSRAEFNTIIDNFAKIGLPHHYIADTHYSKKSNALDRNLSYYMLCNAIFSRYPIIERETCALGNNRICIHTLVQKDNIYISCFNVHLEWDTKLNDDVRGVPYIQTQVNKLALYIYEKKQELDKRDPNIFYVLGGDFNSDLNDPIFAPLNFMYKLNPVMNIINNNQLTPINNNPNPAHNQFITGASRKQIIDGFYIIPPNGYTVNDGRGMGRGRGRGRGRSRTLYGSYFIVPDNNSDHYPIVYDLNL